MMEVQLQETFAAYRRPALLVHAQQLGEAFTASGARLLVLSARTCDRVIVKERIFQQPPSVEVARLTGCKKIISLRRTISDHAALKLKHSIETARLRLAQPAVH